MNINQPLIRLNINSDHHQITQTAPTDPRGPAAAVQTPGIVNNNFYGFDRRQAAVHQNYQLHDNELPSPGSTPYRSPGIVPGLYQASSSQHARSFNAPPFTPLTPTRSRYLDYVSPLRFPNSVQSTPRRRVSFQQLPRVHRADMDNTDPEEGMISSF